MRKAARTSTTRLTGITLRPAVCCSWAYSRSACRIGSAWETPLRLTAGATAQVWRAVPGRKRDGSLPYSGLLVQADRLSKTVVVRIVVMLRIVFVIRERWAVPTLLRWFVDRGRGGSGAVYFDGPDILFAAAVAD